MNDVSAGCATDTIGVFVNGQDIGLAAGANVADLLVARALAGKRVAVELNGAIVPRSRHASTVLASGDRVEIVVAVGGG